MRFDVRTALLRALGVLLVSSFSAFAWAEESDLPMIVKRVDPSIVQFSVGDHIASGFVVDPSGVVVTCHHVFKGEHSATAIFPHEKEPKEIDVDGYLAVLPDKDLLLLKIDPRSRKLQALPLAEDLPARGERVLAFGAPYGFSNTVSDGIVSALRSGAQLRDLVAKLYHQDTYTDDMHYGLDAHWIQTTTPVAPGCAGGPLVDSRGRVVGATTWMLNAGQTTFNFAISVKEIKQLIDGAAKEPRPLIDMPTTIEIPRRSGISFF